MGERKIFNHMQNNRFVISAIILLAIAGIFGFVYLNNKIEVSQHPTQEEWLEVYITHKIREAIDNSPRKVVIDINVEEGKIFVLLRSSTGQTAIPNSGRLAYIDDVKNVISGVLEKQGLTKNYTFSVDYIPE